MKPQTFEEYLKETHAKQYHGTDDDMPDCFEEWLSNHDTQEIIDFAEKWGNSKNN